MIDRRSASSRARVLVLFIIQAVLAGVAPVADARLEAEASRIGVHVECESTACTIAHDHLFCPLCRALEAGAAPALPSAPPPGAAAVRPLTAAFPADLRANALALMAGGPRAPPLA